MPSSSAVPHDTVPITRNKAKNIIPRKADARFKMLCPFVGIDNRLAMSFTSNLNLFFKRNAQPSFL
jgi:hypothetical protein